MFVVIESMSAEFMQAFGNEENITPNLDNLSKRGLFFKDLYATGTRTIRGMEALVLSIPPTPGNSIVRRPNNENLFNISSPLNERGYDSKFIYGGFGYFDNMNYFLEIMVFKLLIVTNFLLMKFLSPIFGELLMKIYSTRRSKRQISHTPRESHSLALS